MEDYSSRSASAGDSALHPHRIDEIAGIFQMAYDVVSNLDEAGEALVTLTPTWCAMRLALRELDRLRDDLDQPRRRDEPRLVVENPELPPAS